MMNTTKQELLSMTREYTRELGATYARAESLTSVESVEQAAAQLERQIAQQDKAANRWLTAAIVGIVAGVLQLIFVLSGGSTGFYDTAFWAYLKATDTWLYLTLSPLLGGLLFIVGMVHRETLESRSTQLERQVAQLRPIKGTDACQSALAYVQAGHKEVLAWRDLAMAERGHLYQFDVSIMYSLHLQAEWNLKEAQAQARTEDACRAVHGIDTPAGDYAAA